MMSEVQGYCSCDSLGSGAHRAGPAVHDTVATPLYFIDTMADSVLPVGKGPGAPICAARFGDDGAVVRSSATGAKCLLHARRVAPDRRGRCSWPVFRQQKYARAVRAIGCQVARLGCLLGDR